MMNWTVALFVVQTFICLISKFPLHVYCLLHLYITFHLFEGMCLRRSEKACTLGEPALLVDRPQVDSEWYLTLTYVIVVRLLVVGD